MKNKEYVRLPGRKASLAGYDRLYLGRDHLLSVQCIGATERYKRFYFQDIQGIVAHRTNRGLGMGIAYFLFAAFFFGMAVALQPDGVVFFGILTAAFVVAFAVNAIRGATCKAFILTSVQTEELRTLDRMGRVRAILDRVRPSVEAVQGKFDPNLLTGDRIERRQLVK